MSKYRDFDALDDEPLRFKAGGKEYEIPSDISTQIMLKIYAKRDSGTTDVDMSMEILQDILGEKAYAEITGSVGFKKFQKLSEWMLAELLGVQGDEAEAEEGNAQSGEAKEKTSASPSPSTPSSNTGPSSKPTLVGIGLYDPQTTDAAVG